jgi:hypothetical protein
MKLINILTTMFVLYLGALYPLNSFAGQGYAGCQTTYEGGVSCGGRSSSCQTTYEGGVSCGGESSSCQTTYEGGVSCGG